MTGIKGFFEADQHAYFLGEPIWITLVIQNTSDKEAYIFVPPGRAGGLQIVLKQGPQAQLKNMSEEPEAGLVGEEHLPAGKTSRHRYLLTQWLLFQAPGEYSVECSIQLEAHNASLRETSIKRGSMDVAISTQLHFTMQ